MTSTLLLEDIEKPTNMSYPNYVAEYLKASPDFMEGVRRGLAEVHEGKIIPWNEVKQELGLGDKLPN